MKRLVMEQFVMDGMETKGYVLNADRIREVCEVYKQDDVKPGDVIVSSHFSAKGGILEIRKIAKLTHDGWEGYGSYLSTVSLETAVLIEHPDYLSKNVEPFNRQQPFYLGYRFDSLNKETIEGWNLYYSCERPSRVSFCVQEFFHNDFWDTLNFSVVLKEQNLSRFLREFLNETAIPSDIVDKVSKM